VRLASEVGMTKEYDEPEAIIVDVEDVVEETAALMVDEPHVEGQVPVYSYAPEEVTHLIDSSGRLLYCNYLTNVRKIFWWGGKHLNLKIDVFFLHLTKNRHPLYPVECR